MRVRRLTFTGCVSLSIVLGALLLLTCTAFAALPDNRAYELVSPVEKGGHSYMPNLVVAAANGEQVIVDGGPANSLLSSDASWMLETRTATGWSGVQVGPPPAPGTEENSIEQRSTALAAVSEDFSSFAFQTYMGLDPRDQPSPPGVRSHFRGRRSGGRAPLSGESCGAQGARGSSEGAAWPWWAAVAAVVR